MNILACEKNMTSVTCMLHVFFKKNITIGKSSNQKSLSSVNIHSLTCSFTERFYLFINIHCLTCNIHSLTSVKVPSCSNV